MKENTIPAKEIKPKQFPKISYGQNDILVTTTGETLIDLFAANGTAWLGHSHPVVTNQVKAQLDKVWLTGALGTPIRDQAIQLINSFFPASHQVYGIYSTGMEAAEFAIRVARVTTQRNGLLGFEQCMHGKSLATSYLGWDNRDQLNIPFMHRLPFLPHCTEAEILERVENALQGEEIAAVFLEPFQASGGGYRASQEFYQRLYRLCQQAQTLLVFDEILTGFYRLGSPFFFSELDFVPDIILLGKSMGNGFPVSAVVVNHRYPLQPKMLPGSTFSDSPLAAAAIVATLQQMQSLEITEKVAQIEQIITTSLADLGMVLRGRGTLWVLMLPKDVDVSAVAINLYLQGVLVNHTRNFLRLIPAVTIELSHLETACAIVRDELKRVLVEA